MFFKKIALALSLMMSLAIGIFAQPSAVDAATNATGQDEKIEYVLFHLETCPHCRDEIRFLNTTVMPKYGEFIDLRMYEIRKPGNMRIFGQYGERYGVDVTSVPLAFIDGEVVRGYSTDSVTGQEILGIIERKIQEKGLAAETASASGGDEERTFRIPWLGEIRPKDISLPFLAVVLGLLDGFNPCAMWVLLFLISLLLGMGDRRRMWILGSIFILTSGISYFVFMAAWLQLMVFLGFVSTIRILIGVIGIGVGGVSLRDFWKHRREAGVACKVSKSDKTKRTMDKLKDLVHTKNFWWSVLGITLLGFSVNLVELACSAGFPAIFTQILALNDVSTMARYGYLLGYIFFYMLDDMIVFGVAMLTLRVVGQQPRFAKYLNAVGGILMLVLGLLLIFKPQWLFFS